MTRSQFRLAVILNPRHNIYHSGYLISAAAALGAQFRVDPAVCPLAPVFEANGVTLAVDCYDSPSVYHEPTLARCDFYFKRSYLAAATPPHVPVEKIRPWGLNYSCRTARALAAVLRLYVRRDFRPDNAKSFLQSPAPADFEAPPDRTPDLRIIFSTRLWPRDQLGPNDDPAAINGFRLELVRRLRQAFGKRFLGGIIPTPEAYEVCPELKASPDLEVKIPHRRTAYARSSRGPAIGVYTRGLHGSNGFKLAEYLASSKCIAGESLAHQLPEPLGDCHRVHDDVEGIVAECDRMLTHPQQLRDVQHASWSYYQRNIRYDRRIDAMFAAVERSEPVRTAGT